MPELAKKSTNVKSGLIYKPEFENGKFFQGDMILQPDQEEVFFAKVAIDDKFASRTGLLHETYHWPKDKAGHVIVTFEIAKNDFSKYLIRILRNINHLI